MQVVLDSFYAEIRTYDVSQGCATFDSDSALREDDVICIFESGLMTHVGKLKKSEGENQVLSKIGLGRIVRSNLGFLTRSYSADAVTVYRLIPRERERASKN